MSQRSAVSFQAVESADFEELAELRVLAMRESLERVGRFDPVRARERLRSSFLPERTRFILINGFKVGFYATRLAPEGLWLDHLYIHPAHQGKGIGGVVFKSVIDDAAGQALPLWVGALKESASNRFYQRHGFVFHHATEWDNYYLRVVQRNCPVDLISACFD